MFYGGFRLDLQNYFYLILAALVLAVGIFVAYPYLVQKPAHLSCVNQQCQSVEGAGADECKTFADCGLASPSPPVIYNKNTGTVSEGHAVPSPTPQEERPEVVKAAQACAAKLSAALASMNISKCAIDGCRLASSYCLMAISDKDCPARGASASKSKRWDCQLNQALKAKDNSLCKAILDPRNNLCAAVYDRSYSECDSVKDRYYDYKLVCPSLIALFKKDAGACRPELKECPELVKALK